MATIPKIYYNIIFGCKEDGQKQSFYIETFTQQNGRSHYEDLALVTLRNMREVLDKNIPSSDPLLQDPKCRDRRFHQIALHIDKGYKEKVAGHFFARLFSSEKNEVGRLVTSIYLRTVVGDAIPGVAKYFVAVHIDTYLTEKERGAFAQTSKWAKVCVLYTRTQFAKQLGFQESPDADPSKFLMSIAKDVREWPWFIRLTDPRYAEGFPPLSENHSLDWVCQLNGFVEHLKHKHESCSEISDCLPVLEPKLTQFFEQPLLGYLNSQFKPQVTPECLTRLDVVDDKGRYPLHYAVLSGFEDNALLMIESGADVNAVEQDLPETQVHSNVYIPGLEGREEPGPGQKRSVLHLSCAGNLINPRVVDLLLRKGAHVNERDSHGRTALSYAAESGNKEAVDLLLQYGADSNICDNQGRDPLLFGADFPDVLESLLNAGAKTHMAPPAIGLRFRSALDSVCFRQDTLSLKRLLESGADLNTEFMEPLHSAISRDWSLSQENYLFIQMLLERGADPWRRDEEGSTALRLALKKGYYASWAGFKILCLLLSYMIRRLCG